MLQFAHIVVGEGSGLSCVRCAAPSADTYLASSQISDSVRSVASAWDAAPGPNIILSGPEPFAHPDLPVLVAACVEAGIERICLETDGGALSVEANAAGVLRAGVRHLRVRLLAADEALADELSGRSGRCRDALAGVRNFLSAAEASAVRVSVTALVPVCEHNLVALPSTIAGLAQYGFHGVRLVRGGALPSPASAILAAACDTGMVNRLWVEVEPGLPLPASHRLHAVAEGVRDD